MKRIAYIFSVLLWSAALVYAKGRQPGENKGFGWDDSRVKRGSPANPNSSYKPPQFESYGPTEPDRNTEEEEKPNSIQKQKPRKTKEEPPVEEMAEPAAQPPAATPVQPPVTTLESGEQALPEDDASEKPAAP